MKALRFERHGEPDVLFTADLPSPAASADTAIVKVLAASINPSDVKNVAGRMTQTTLPRTPGRDYSGVVVAGPTQWLGADVWGSGDTGFTRDGTHAEQLAVPVASLRRKPRTLSHEEAASIGVNFVTAWCGIVEAAQVTARDTVAIIGLGGVGGAAAQIARRLGAKVIGVTRGTPSHPAVDTMLDSRAGDVVERLHALTEGGATVVFDTVGGSMFDTALGMLGLRGRLIEISATDRRQVTFDLADFYHNESRLIGVDTLKRDPSAAATILEALRPGFEDGSYRPPVIAARYALAEAARAYRAVLTGTAGRVVLTP
ncbi:zinc-binding alcohol dehydrogenase family protein [Robbsia sp. Bb-Pol-6]|uniref:Zinc-binding alcohol dehydrogenase family protein n=1 Tax=Robbsia betulipollinis TaxID=2981849 RepID=A0ABT3ZHV7_9BURK|nr:zinc-binding alcohol dehydrogenase family protein [Robbsia betulipollinis]MCY0385937.1 zinc-binding alcohol dehydrogenase family protein [Robbsia betulipollinis]